MDKIVFKLPGTLTSKKAPEANPAGLTRYLEPEILLWCDRQRTEIEAGPQIRKQALKESLDPERLESLGRYEVHLDRKFERTLSWLLKLQELRRHSLTNEACD